MTKKLLKLFLLLVIVVLIGIIVLKDEEEVEEVKNYELAETHLIVVSSPTYIKSDVLSTKGVKGVETSDLSLNKGKEYYRELIEQYDWNHDVAWAVMREESHFQPAVYNIEGHNGCNGSFGLFQIACVHIGKYGVNHYRDLYDPETNVRVAHEIWKEQGWQPWGVCHIQNGIRKVRCWL